MTGLAAMPFTLGSSPHGRGKLPESVKGEGGQGLIPAWAGKTSCITVGSPEPEAHPRMGGENLPRVAWATVGAGSSPRGRGKLHHAEAPIQQIRLIPARAGKTTPDASRSFSYQAHPRAGGENFGELAGEFAASGSSPRGRGKRTPRTAALDKARLIPARAGKTLFAWRHWIVGRAHPRAGGENDPGSKETMALPGSSPRGRGKRDVAGGDRVGCGLIPARAGKTEAICLTSFETSAHPRAGGENRARRTVTIPAPGSSPRGRGKRRQRQRPGQPAGLIPARAGKTPA